MSSPLERNSAASRIYANAQLPRNLMGGVEAMRNASLGATLGNPSVNVSTWSYLPRWPLETVEAWRERVASTFLEPYYSGAWQSLVGKAFGEGITLSDDVASQSWRCGRTSTTAGRMATCLRSVCSVTRCT